MSFTPLAAAARTLWFARRVRHRQHIESYHRRASARLVADAARTTDFYAAFSEADFADLPPVDKAMQLADFAAFNTQKLDAETARRCANGDEQRPGFEIGQSTGTSGLRGLYVISAAERFRWLGTILAKTLPDALTARHRVAIVLPGPSPLYRVANESRLLALAHFDPRHGLEPIARLIEDFRPTVLLAAPKSLRGLSSRLRLPYLKKVLAAGEVLDAFEAADIARAFARPLGQVYMATEGLLGTSCPHGFLHLAEDIARLELLPIDGDPTLATYLYTDLIRRTQIMARYRLGDVLRLIEGAWPCGSAMRRVNVLGRQMDLINVPTTAGRVTLAPDVLAKLITAAHPTIEDFRLGLTGDGQALRLLLPMDCPPIAGAAARRAIDAYLQSKGAVLNVEVESAGLAPPFDRKLRRIAPVLPETL
jgi:putative adenylate-forming enzyme